MKLLITGATGLLGRKLVSLLEQRNDIKTVASARKAISFYTGVVDTLLLDVTDRASVLETIQAQRPDVIINAAAMTQVDDCELKQEECWKQNVHSVQNLVEACEQSDVHLVHVSTDFVFNGTHGPLDETALPDPISFYGKSKLEGERIIQQSKVRASILRTVLVYGVTSDMSRSNIVLWVKNSLEAKKPIRVVNDQFRTPTLAEDLATGCLLAAEKRVQGIYHISGDEMMTPYDIAMRTARFFGLDESLISPTDASQFTQPAKRPQKTGFIIDKAKRELGYKPHTFDEGLAIVREQLKRTAP